MVNLCMPAYYADVVCKRTRCYFSGEFETPIQSVAGSVGAKPAAVSSKDILVQPKPSDSIFTSKG